MRANRHSAYVRIALLATAAASHTAPARAAEPPATAPAPASSLFVAELADRPVDVPGLNLSVRLPVGAVAESSGVGLDSRLNVKSSPDPAKNLWLLQAFASVSRDATLTPAKVIDSIIEQRRNAQIAVNPATRRRMQVRAFDRTDDLVINSAPAARVYLDIPEATNLPSAGYTVFMPTPGTFIIFQFDCPAANLEAARPIVETAIATTAFRDQRAENALRKHGINEAQHFLSSLTTRDLEAALLSQPVLMRLYQPKTGPAGNDLEVGYQKITLRKGQAGEVSNTDKFKWTRDDREFGLLAKVEARGLIFPPGVEASAVSAQATPPEPLAIVDSVSIFWLSSDRANETGSVVNIVKRADKADTYVQTFIRRGQRLTVQTNAPAQPPKSQDYDKLPDGYISRVELALLPRLIALRAADPDNSENSVFNFYSFDFTAGKLAMRRDEFTPNPAPTAAPGVQTDAPRPGWSWLSLPYEGQPDRQVTATLDAAGNTITRSADGVTTEPIEGPALLQLWKDRKLPIEAN